MVLASIRRLSIHLLVLLDFSQTTGLVPSVVGVVKESVARKEDQYASRNFLTDLSDCHSQIIYHFEVLSGLVIKLKLRLLQTAPQNADIDLVSADNVRIFKLLFELHL